MKQNAKICAIVEQNVIKLKSLSLEDKELIRERRDGGEGEERGLRKGAERGYRDSEKRDKRELS